MSLEAKQKAASLPTQKKARRRKSPTTRCLVLTCCQAVKIRLFLSRLQTLDIAEGSNSTMSVV